MTIVELYDEDYINNVICALSVAPDKQIIIGDIEKMQDFKEAYNGFRKRKGWNFPVEYRNIDTCDIKESVGILKSIIDEDDCLFDLSGGSETLAFILGELKSKYPDKKFSVQKYDIASGKIIDCDNDNVISAEKQPVISIEELVILYGGVVRYLDNKTNVSDRWNLTDDFVADISTLWDIAKKNSKQWNKICSFFSLAASQCESLSISARVSDILSKNISVKLNENEINHAFRNLSNKGIIKDYRLSCNTISFEFKNNQIKKCLICSGAVLELKVLVAAKSLKDLDGNPIVTDAANSVLIDWLNKYDYTNEDKMILTNEIDIVLMRGIKSYFISCKNGDIDEEELYKLSVVANEFGGTNSKKIIFLSTMQRDINKISHLKLRAKELNIEIITDFNDNKTFERKLMLAIDG